MSILSGAVNPRIYGGNITVVPNTGGNHNISNDIVALLYSQSAPAGLLDAKDRVGAPKCDEGTRTSIIREMTKFVQDGGVASSPALYWLYGPAGVGKSALAQSLSVLLKSKNDHAASFFFSRTSPGRNNGNQLIVTLAFQLAVNIPELQPFMSEIVRKNPAILAASNAVQMQNLIIDPINQWQMEYKGGVRRWAHKILNIQKKLHPRLILVEGLDECSDHNVQQDLICCIGSAVRQLSLPFRFVIASRPESHILETFELNPDIQGLGREKVTKKNLGDDEDADKQITSFLEKEFAQIRQTHPIRDFLPQPWPLPDQIAQLVSKSSQGFIYPVTIIRYIKMRNNRPDECLNRILGLSEIPIQDKPYEPLDILYRHIFESVPDANKEAVHNIFHFLVLPNKLDVLRTPLLIEQYFDYKPGHVQHVLHDLLCLVAFTRHAIKVLHASLPDFLLDRVRSSHLCIDVGNAHAAIAASFPLVLSKTDISRLPGFAFVTFLEHMMQANMSNALAYRKLVNVDLRSRYRKLSNIRLAANGFKFDSVRYKTQHVLEGTAFVTAYLLVLLIKNARQVDIRRHITEIKAYILRKYPSAASLHAVCNELFSAMIPLFCKWASSTITNQYISYIFAFEVPASQCEIRDEIFKLYLVMLAPFFGRTAVDQNYSPNIHLQPRTQQLTNYSNHISHTLLDFLLRNYNWSPLIRSLMLLAVDLLGVSLAHAGYSALLMTVLNLFDAGNTSTGIVGVEMRRIAPSVTAYLQRVYLEAPARFQQEILELTNSWK